MYTAAQFNNANAVITCTLWNVELGVTRLIGKASKDDSLLAHKSKGVSQARTGGVSQGSQPAPFPPAGQQLIQLQEESN